jgi:hypothetical protein
VKTRIENVFRVRPEDFWTKLFFDDEYNRGLYRELRFESYEVLSLERSPEGRIRRVLRATPPLNGPDLLRRRLQGHIFYTEEGTYDPASASCQFVNRTSVAAGTTHIAGTISVEPHAEGLKHIVDLDVNVSALGLGGVIERAIERNTRESYLLTTAYTNAFALERGLSPSRSTDA